MKTFNEMNRDELRQACREANIKYGNMTTAQMKEILQADLDRKTKSAKAVQGKKAKKEKAEKQPRQNGVTMPKPLTTCREIWDALSTYRRVEKEVPTFETVRSLMLSNGWNRNTAFTQFQRWKEYYGLMPIAQATKE